MLVLIFFIANRTGLLMIKCAHDSTDAKAKKLSIASTRQLILALADKNPATAVDLIMAMPRVIDPSFAPSMLQV